MTRPVSHIATHLPRLIDVVTGALLIGIAVLAVAIGGA